MDTSSLMVIVTSIAITLIALFTAIALPFIAASRSGRRHAGGPPGSAETRKRTGVVGPEAGPQRPGGDDAAPAGYLYVPCVGIRYNGSQPQRRRWVQEVPIVKKTAKLIYYTSDSWDRREAVVSPGCISREEFETDTRCRHGYPAGVIPIPGHRLRPRPAGRLFFATRRAAEDHLYRGERDRAGQAAPQAPPIKELRRAMADAHPDRGGTAEQFIQARHRYQIALRAAQP